MKRAMNSGGTIRAVGGERRSRGPAAVRRAERPVALLGMLLLAATSAFAQHGNHPPAPTHPAPQPHAAAPRPNYNSGGAQRAPSPRPAYPAAPFAAPNGNAGRAPYTPYVPYRPANRVPTPPRLNGPNVTGPHLGNWLQNHQGESFNSQANSLRQERGFNQLPQQQQQRLIDRLHQIDSMPPDQRQRTLGRIENMERLAPGRRQEVRSSAQELGAMDPSRKQQVRGAFRTLRDLPPGEREQALNSPEYRSQYSDHERQILSNLLSVEPYQPR